MKKLILLMIAAMLALSLSACAVKTEQAKVPIKCPACGYEGLDYIYQP
ncbi:hypothetical protein [Geoalkalibacter halelectricus]|uniref:Lipoprotein n=1 Tax=Geoalkalibacter halelectricus TaxID=2847045 RepID=A0ABY5ZLV8_9BACT|nr:hypothetical protein [Geoalkalibacter halelectricus]MDO3377251.1 hypothetical protein [Geoalkalibacter halelectricus]UWZ78890.1 hypothetical protein L9S41_14550 [Geoalkalibacter halelectricus]